MNRLLLIIAALCFSAPLWAQQTPITEGNNNYSKGEYKKAIEHYELVLKTNIESPEIYFNLGNAYYKTGQIAPSILNYERAQLLSPNDDDIKYNLQMAQQHVLDKLEILPEFFLNRWFRGIQNSFSADAWSWISIALFIITLILAGLYLFSNKPVLRKIGFFFGGIAIVLCITTWGFASSKTQLLIKRNTAIVFTPSVTIKGSPDKSGTELFLLHEGTKVNIIDSLGDWRNIQLSDGNQGWLKKEDIEVI